MATPKPRRATYQDILNAPEHTIAEIVDGELVVSPRPAPRHSLASSVLMEGLSPPFSRGRGGPGGWILLFEPEVHVGDDVLVPDLAGWRRERMPKLPAGTFVAVAPDWIAEVLSPATEKVDRSQKLATYARWGVRHVWLVHPLLRTLEVLRLHDDGWLVTGIFRDGQRVRAEPFEAIELDLADLWSDVEPPPPPFRAAERIVLYETESAEAP